MRKTLALLISVLMIVSCFSIIASAEAAEAPVIVDGTANSTGAVIRNQSTAVTAAAVTGVSDGTVWADRTPETVWTYDEGLEQLQKSNVSNGYYPTIKVNQADGSTADLQVYGSRAKFASPTMITSFEVFFESKTTENRKTYTNGSKLYASVDGENWDELYTFSDVAAATTYLPITIEGNENFYNYVALYTTSTDNNLCRLMMIIPYGHTQADAIGTSVVQSYGQVSKYENDPTQTAHDRGFATQQNIWKNGNTGEVQYNTDNFDTPHTLKLTDGTEAQGYGAAAKLSTPATLKYFTVVRNGGNGTAKSWGQQWGDMRFYGSTDGGKTWTVIANGAKITHSYGTNLHSFVVYDKYTETVFTDVALLTTSQFRIRNAVPYGAPAFAPEGEVLDNMTTIDDGTQWITSEEDANKYREPSDVWEKTNKVFQLHKENVHSIGAMGLGAAAKLEYPTKLTGFKIDLDMSAGKELWKARVNYLSVYASVDGEEWVKLHTISGIAEDTNDTSYVITVDDDTLYNYVGIYTTRPDLGIRFKNIAAYGEEENEAMILRGYQMKHYTDEKGVDRTAVRFVATIDKAALENQTLGFDIVASYVKAGVAGQQTFDVTTKYVYESIIANGNILTMDDIAPGTGHEYMALGTIMDINRATYDNVTFTVTPYVINAEGVKVSYAPVTVTVATGYTTPAQG